MDYKLFWTQEAINNLEEILEYLGTNWTEREVSNFKNKLSKQLGLIQQFPKMFPKSVINPHLRKAVLSKQTTKYYELSGNIIYLIFLFVNSKDINRIK